MRLNLIPLLRRATKRAVTASRAGSFRRDESGATVVEFSLIALPFFLFIFVIIETGLMLWSSQILDRAVGDASRKLYTGEFQAAHGGVSDPAVLGPAFKTEVCKNVALFDCTGTLKVDVQTFTAFPSTGLSIPIKDGEIDPSFGGFERPNPGDIVLVRVAGAQQVIVPIVHVYLANLKGNRRLIMASAAFRAEPF